MLRLIALDRARSMLFSEVPSDGWERRVLAAISAAPFVVGIFAACAPLLAAKWHADPHAGPATAQLLHNLAIAWMESASRNFGLCAFGVIFFGLAVALYERSRCFDEPDIPAAA